MNDETKQEIAQNFRDAINGLRDNIRKYRIVMDRLAYEGDTELIRRNGARGVNTARALNDQFQAMADDLICSNFFPREED